METYTYEQYRESAEVLRARLGGFTPKVLLILGSGLGALGDGVCVEYVNRWRSRLYRCPGCNQRSYHPGGFCAYRAVSAGRIKCQCPL